MPVPAFVKTLGSAFNKSAGTTLNLTTTGATTAGNLIVAYVVFDNFTTASKPVVSSIGRMAGETNTWVSLGAARSTSTSAGAFASGELWCILTTVNWSAAAYTLTLDSSVTMKAFGLVEFSGVTATLRNTAGTAYSTSTTAASASTTGTTPQVNDLVLGWIFTSNQGTSPLGDNDSTGGTWRSGTAVGIGSTGGSGASNNFGIDHYKVLTAASHQTLNNMATLTAGNGAIVAILQAAPDPSITQAAYRFYAEGSESGSTTLAAQDTAPSVDVSSGDVALQLRVCLQNTSANPVWATDDFRLQVNLDNSNYEDVTATSPSWTKGFDSANLTEGASTTNRLTGGTGTFVAGKVSEDGEVNDLGWSANNYTELLYSLVLPAVALVNGDTLWFRVLYNGAVTNMTYSVTPTINITKAIDERDRLVTIASTVTTTDVIKYKDLAGDAYLQPSIGRASTPDPGPLPSAFVFVVKLRGPSADSAVASQDRGDPNRSWIFWRLSNGNIVLSVYSTGSQFPNTSLFNQLPAAITPTVPQYLAGSMDYTVGLGQSRTWVSANGGASYTMSTSYDYGAVPITAFDSSDVMTIGADGTGSSSIFNDQIYWIELRTGANPTGGTVLWRFDASDYPGSGTSYADPRGRTWTLTSAAAVIPPKMTHKVTATVSVTDVLKSVPGAPTALVGTPGNAQVALTWIAPASDGGSAITDYIVQYREVASVVAYTDDFNRADGTLTSPWGASFHNGHLSIVSNVVSDTNDSLGSVYTAWSAGNDQYAEIDALNTIATGDGCVAPGVRKTSSGFYYTWLHASTNTVQLWKHTAPSTYDSLGSASAGGATSGRLRVQAVGSTIKAFFNDVEVISVTDTTWTTGQPCISAYASPGSGTVTADNFECGVPKASTGPEYTDNFDRANGAVGSPWVGGWAVSSNKAIRSTGTEFCLYSQDLGSPDHYNEVDVYVASFGVINVRRQSDNTNKTGYLAYINPSNGHAIIARNNPGFTILVEGTDVYETNVVSGIGTSTHRLRLEVEGTAIRFYIDGALALSTTDSAVTTGNYVGFNAADSQPLYDNFECGPLVAAPVVYTDDFNRADGVPGSNWSISGGR